MVAVILIVKTSEGAKLNFIIGFDLMRPIGTETKLSYYSGRGYKYPVVLGIIAVVENIGIPLLIVFYLGTTFILPFSHAADSPDGPSNIPDAKNTRTMIFISLDLMSFVSSF